MNHVFQIRNLFLNNDFFAIIFCQKYALISKTFSLLYLVNETLIREIICSLFAAKINAFVRLIWFMNN